MWISGRLHLLSFIDERQKEYSKLKAWKFCSYKNMLLELLTTIEGLDRFMEKGGSMIWPMKMGGLKD